MMVSFLHIHYDTYQYIYSENEVVVAYQNSEDPPAKRSASDGKQQAPSPDRKKTKKMKSSEKKEQLDAESDRHREEKIIEMTECDFGYVYLG